MSSEAIAPVFAITIVLVFVGYLIYGVGLLVAAATEDIRKSFVLKIQNQVKGHLKEDYEKYLSGFSYYQKLPEALKVKFILRVKNFIANKTFEGREELVVTEEMKTLVAASAVQLTFGLNRYLLDHFERIVLYPDSYFSPIGQAYHMGETNPRGIIVLSWNDLVKGFSDGNDAYNVGLHEMAHALELGMLLQEDYDFYFGQYFIKFSHVATQEYLNISDERDSFLRKYAGVNRREFFAVCIEYFFEASEEFKKRLPQIYYHLCVLLNQDPLNKDTHIEQVKRKDFDILRVEVETSVPVFITEYSMFNLSPNLLLPPFIFVMMGLNNFKQLGFAFYPLLILFAVLCIFTYYSLNKILLYENYLAVKNVWGETLAVYYLEDIVSVSFNPGRQSDRMELITASGGKIITHSHTYLSKESAIEKLTAMLKEKDVPIR